MDVILSDSSFRSFIQRLVRHVLVSPKFEGRLDPLLQMQTKNIDGAVDNKKTAKSSSSSSLAGWSKYEARMISDIKVLIRDGLAQLYGRSEDHPVGK